MQHHELQKVLSGNRITLPKEFVKAASIKPGDMTIVEWYDRANEVTVKIAEVHARNGEKKK